MIVLKKEYSLAALIVANLVPAIGVLFFGWDAKSIVILYWFENVIVGAYALLRILYARGSTAYRIATACFFAVHFGLFTFVHGNFVMPMTTGSWPSFSQALRGLSLPIVSLFLSHGYSFVANYLIGGERAHADVSTEMKRPYRRIIVMHLTIIGAYVVMLQFTPPSARSTPAFGMLAALVLIGLKTAVDAWAHVKAHAGRREEAEPRLIPRVIFSNAEDVDLRSK